jgi:hypothetical protein
MYSSIGRFGSRINKTTEANEPSDAPFSRLTP